MSICTLCVNQALQYDSSGVQAPASGHADACMLHDHMIWKRYGVKEGDLEDLDAALYTLEKRMNVEISWEHLDATECDEGIGCMVIDDNFLVDDDGL
jgi:hypothetical protein